MRSGNEFLTQEDEIVVPESDIAMAFKQIQTLMVALQNITEDDIVATNFQLNNLQAAINLSDDEEKESNLQKAKEFVFCNSIATLVNELKSLRQLPVPDRIKTQLLFEYAERDFYELQKIKRLKELNELQKRFLSLTTGNDSQQEESDLFQLQIKMESRRIPIAKDPEGFFARMESKFFDFFAKHSLLTIFLAFAVPTAIALILVFSGGAAAIPMGIGAFLMESGAAWACAKIAVALVLTEAALMFVNLMKNLWGAAKRENIVDATRLSDVDWLLDDRTSFKTRPRRMSVAEIQQSLPPVHTTNKENTEENKNRDDSDNYLPPDYVPQSQSPPPQPQPQPEPPARDKEEKQPEQVLGDSPTLTG